ncbi:uncharacterized protein Z519_04464 [Cladophialophora bantiana CBS 173.52]|uniref:DUF1330 domain-containing protein n=1 Tax=Cladophialophora bantiana (strain ATCC 10958 / CBS 173.52 / CDC B-1940 / NIH 8579) TaxID=1442370 RepID=A0A0D2HME7_CLAB1|nr:uncharacterized protein Z519_04464 [Cladophialophora bantiana CBS 173.52]KIW94488.1 hypothetical protein Z519_04464 [Cladophialophora bantiana CBS 173.52]
MPLATIHLISLTPSTPLVDFLGSVKSSPLTPLVISKVVRWIITPTKIDAGALLRPRKPWDILLIVLGADPLPSSLKEKIACQWSCSTGIPSRLTTDFPSRNDKLLHPPASDVPPLTGSLDKPRLAATSQTLELSADLQSWIQQFSRTNAGQSPLSMLNLLAFKPGMKPSYLTYGAAFAESIGSRRGGNAKLVGNITHQNPPEQSGGKWDEFALASYPSIMHFADMLASEDYQAVNMKYRVPALEDTCILCTSEIEIEDLVRGQEQLGIGKRAMGGKL